MTVQLVMQLVMSLKILWLPALLIVAVQLAYAIGVAHPVSIMIDTAGTCMLTMIC